MFRKQIQNNQISRNGSNYPQETHTGYNTQRHDRYIPEDPRGVQKKSLTSGHFGQLKKNQSKASELVIRQCDANELNNFKKNTPRQSEEPTTFHFGGSSSKKQRLGIGSRKNFEPGSREALQEVYYNDRDNTPRNDRYSNSSSNFGDFSVSDFQGQLQNLKQYFLQLNYDHSTQLKKIRNEIKTSQNENVNALQDITNQISKQLNKQKQDIHRNKFDVQALKTNLTNFIKDNEQKMQSIVLDIHGNNQRSKNLQEFSMDLKSSSQNFAVGTSMSVNFQTENLNFKLYNQMSAQLDILKLDFDKCKQRIQILQKQKSKSQLLPLQTFEPVQPQKIDLKQVQKLVISKITDELKKTGFATSISTLLDHHRQMDLNIKGINAEFTRVLNGTIIKKQKTFEVRIQAVQQKLTEMAPKLTPNFWQQNLAEMTTKFLQDRTSKTKILKVRQPSTQQKKRLQISKQNSNGSCYLLDQDGYLMDHTGSYLLEQSGKNRIKIQNDLLYLLECSGLPIGVL